MSTPFSTVTAGTDWQSADWINAEIIDPLNERLRALNDESIGEVAPVELGDDIQSASFWSNIQDKINTWGCYWSTPSDNKLGTGFVDHVNGPLTADSKEWRPWTISALHAAAQGGATNFRASVDGVLFQFRTMQSGDVIGPWIMRDIVACLNLLRFVSYYTPGSVYEAYKGVGTGATAADAKAAAIADYHKTGEASASGVYAAASVCPPDPPGGAYAQSDRLRSKIHVVLPELQDVAKSLTVFGKVGHYFGTTLRDIDAWGFSDDDVWIEMHDHGEESRSDFVTDYYGTADDPMLVHPGVSTTSYTYYLYNFHSLCDWHFTKQNP